MFESTMYCIHFEIKPNLATLNGWMDRGVEKISALCWLTLFTTVSTTLYHCQPLFTTAYHCLPLPTTAYHCLPLFQPLFQPLFTTVSTTVYHLLPLSTTANHCLPLSTTAYHCQPLFTTF